MAKVQFICLANSWKMGGRCVAGVGAQGWIRPVSGIPGGTLFTEYRYANGAEAGGAPGSGLETRSKRGRRFFRD